MTNWPREPHGIFVDHQDNVWVGSYNRHRVMKFTRTGKLLLTLGEYEKTNGSADTHLLGGPSGIWVDPNSNEVFISDGYRNRRVIVFDINGKYLRHWGAYGNVPDDTERFDPKTMVTGALPNSSRRRTSRGQGRQDSSPIARQSRAGVRSPGQVPGRKAEPNTGRRDPRSRRCSPDPQQRGCIADGTNHAVRILRRSDLEIPTSAAAAGRTVLRPHGMSTLRRAT
jgi:hypothetical protein